MCRVAGSGVLNLERKMPRVLSVSISYVLLLFVCFFVCLFFVMQ